MSGRLFPSRKTIVFELNEVPFSVLRPFAARYPKSAIATLLAHGSCATTFAPDEGELSPWTTWPTLHRGTTRHGISELGQDPTEADREYPPLWQLLARGGIRVGVFGQMHSYPVPSDRSGYAFYVPDTFAPDPETFPVHFSAFQRFNLAMTSRNGRNVTTGVARRDAARFLRAAPRLGLSLTSAADVARQLLAERLKPERVCRRRSLQAVLAFDLFRTALRRTRPDCAFFFTNHVASAQHRYWPAAFPGDYSAQWWTDEWAATYRGEIRFALGQADRMLAWLVAFARRYSYTLVVAGSMGQAANDRDMTARTQLLLCDPGKLMDKLGIFDWRQRLAMQPVYTFECSDPAASRFRSLKVNGNPIRVNSTSGTVSFELGQTNLERPQISVGERIYECGALGIENVVIQDQVGSAAGHVPEGAMIVFDGSPGQPMAGSIPTTKFAPALLRAFRLTPPSHMC